MAEPRQMGGLDRAVTECSYLRLGVEKEPGVAENLYRRAPL